MGWSERCVGRLEKHTKHDQSSSSFVVVDCIIIIVYDKILVFVKNHLVASIQDYNCKYFF